jgi:hypothetical protein
LLLFFAVQRSGESGTARLPAGVRRVVFSGDSITANGTHATPGKTHCVTRHPARPVEWEAP